MKKGNKLGKIIGSLLKGTIGGTVAGIADAIIPNLRRNKSDDLGGEGKIHTWRAITSVATAILTVGSLVYVIIALLKGEDIETVKNNLEIINDITR